MLLAAAFLLGAAAAEAAPRIKFEETQLDFGVLIQGATVQKPFVFRNKGNKPLVIESVQTSCGCTAALPEQREIAPGGRSQILVAYDSRGKMGDIHKVVRVKTNDPKSPVTHIVVRGLVVPSDHPDMTGTRNLLQGSCKTCHVDQGLGKTGEALYRADCAMCHEHHKMGGVRIAPSAEEMAGLDAKGLRAVIATGRPDTSMPGYHVSAGGPLSDKEIDSLVKFIKDANKR